MLVLLGVVMVLLLVVGDILCHPLTTGGWQDQWFRHSFNVHLSVVGVGRGSTSHGSDLVGTGDGG